MGKATTKTTVVAPVTATTKEYDDLANLLSSAQIFYEDLRHNNTGKRPLTQPKILLKTLWFLSGEIRKLVKQTKQENVAVK